MPSKQVTEEEIQSGIRVGYEGVIVESAVDSGSIIFALEKAWVNTEFSLGGEVHKVGFSFVPPAGKEILVASARTSAASLPEGCISTDELKTQMSKIADAVAAYRDRAKENQSNKNSF